jgi:hypothetical protein
MPTCVLVIPSRCTVLIQNSLLVDWFGLTDLTSAADAVVLLLLTAAVFFYSFASSFATAVLPCAIAFCRFWPLLMPIIIAAVTTDADMIATAISCICFAVIFFLIHFVDLLSVVVFI